MGDPADIKNKNKNISTTNVNKLPSNVNDVIKLLKTNELLNNTLGENVINAISAVKLSDEEYFKDKTLNDEIDLLQLRY